MGKNTNISAQLILNSQLMYSNVQRDDLVIKYVGEQGSSIEANINSKRKDLARVYFEKKWVNCDK